MVAKSAQIVDFQAYRNARLKAAPSAMDSPAAASFQALQPMMMWVPVWTFFPVMPSPWLHAQ